MALRLSGLLVSYSCAGVGEAGGDRDEAAAEIDASSRQTEARERRFAQGLCEGSRCVSSSGTAVVVGVVAAAVAEAWSKQEIKPKCVQKHDLLTLIHLLPSRHHPEALRSRPHPGGGTTECREGPGTHLP